MPGLTAKVFRTYNASNTLQQQLDALTEPDANATAKLLQYNRANRAVAILCNHQRAAPKTFDQQMTNLVNKVCSNFVLVLREMYRVLLFCFWCPIVLVFCLFWLSLLL